MKSKKRKQFKAQLIDKASLQPHKPPFTSINELPTLLDGDNKMVEEYLPMATLLGECFASNFSISSQSTVQTTGIINAPVCAECEVLELLQKLNNHKAPGPFFSYEQAL